MQDYVTATTYQLVAWKRLIRQRIRNLDYLSVTELCESAQMVYRSNAADQEFRNVFVEHITASFVNAPRFVDHYEAPFDSHESWERGPGRALSRLPSLAEEGEDFAFDLTKALLGAIPAFAKEDDVGDVADQEDDPWQANVGGSGALWDDWNTDDCHEEPCARASDDAHDISSDARRVENEVAELRREVEALTAKVQVLEGGLRQKSQREALGQIDGQPTQQQITRAENVHSGYHDDTEENEDLGYHYGTEENEDLGYHYGTKENEDLSSGWERQRTIASTATATEESLPNNRWLVFPKGATITDVVGPLCPFLKSLLTGGQKEGHTIRGNKYYSGRYNGREGIFPGCLVTMDKLGW